MLVVITSGHDSLNFLASRARPVSEKSTSSAYYNVLFHSSQLCYVDYGSLANWSLPKLYECYGYGLIASSYGSCRRYAVFLISSVNLARRLIQSSSPAVPCSCYFTCRVSPVFFLLQVPTASIMHCSICALVVFCRLSCFVPNSIALRGNLTKAALI